CQWCWKWGHTMGMCCCPAVHCPICSGPHMEANHCLITRCCCRNPKATPPIPPTPTDVPCLHVHACINCGNPHAANNWHCPYWRHQFNWTWIK
ncbi:hypothetical protein P691DRAFT_626615, partial [Macrolepiota fuliginosa MF-IS2]